MKEVFPGIFRIPLQPIPQEGEAIVASYLIRGDKDWLLIDAGWGTEEAYQSLAAQLGEIGVSAQEIGQILITHAHPDHLGHAARLRRLSGAKVIMHEKERDAITGRYLQMDKFCDQMEDWFARYGAPPDASHALALTFRGVMIIKDPALPDVIFHGGETLSTGVFNFEVLWTPGHTLGHICLYEPKKKVLISGDHVTLPTITPNINFYPGYPATILDDFMKSFRDLKTRDIGLVLPGHGEIFSDPNPRLDERLNYHEERKAEVLGKLRGASRTAYQVTGEMSSPADRGFLSWAEMDTFERRRSMLEIMAHLEDMQAEGKLKKAERDGVFYFQPA
ncbi:MAG: MBL fold metallo-hydrolase [Chloroflexota bacterium]